MPEQTVSSSCTNYRLALPASQWYTSGMSKQNQRDSEKAYEGIVQMLLSGDVSETQPLSERGLSETLGLGRTPIREAIKDLVREGVLESHPTRGTILRPFSIEDLQDLYELRGAIEGLAAQLAAERGQVEELEAYAVSFEATLRDPEAFDMTVVHDHGVEFHFEIMRLAGNRRLLEMYRPFRLRFRIPFGIVRHRNPERVLSSLREHQEIVQAILARDGARASTLMRAHLDAGLRYRMDVITRRGRPAVRPAEDTNQKGPWDHARGEAPEQS